MMICVLIPAGPLPELTHRSSCGTSSRMPPIEMK
jgi:hypothetical protein